MFGWLRRWLRESNVIHVREQNVASTEDALALIDRFIDDELRYPLEWDDFISWSSDVPGVEAIRERIAALEPLAFSVDPAERARFAETLIVQRNELASLLGLHSRAR